MASVRARLGELPPRVFYWRRPESFDDPPPAEFPPEYCVLLAGAAEYLCNRYDLDKPDWLEDADLFLPEL